MASAKEYEIMFRLNAQQNSGFAAAFNKARAEFTRLGGEIQNLQRIQADISSYQKQKKAIEATERKLENLTRQQTLIRKQIEESKAAGESTAALERQELRLEQQIANTNTALERQREKLGATGERLRDAGVDTDNLAGKEAELTAQIKELQERQEEAANGAQSFGERSAQAFSAVSSAIAAAGVATALHEIYEGYMECINAAGGFEQSMATVQALSGASVSEMARLGDLAKELGATTQFTARQSADAMGYMAMAGWDAEQMLSGMPGVLQLAAASGEDLAMVADIVTDSLTAFGLTAADTAHYADVLAATATNANTNVAMMGETFKYVAPIAGALGYSAEDMSVAIGLMANAGIKGSMAGTSLRNTIDGLSEAVTLSASAFGEAEVTAVNADGSMKGFSATLDELRTYFDQMTEAEKRNNAEAISGQQGYAGLLAILNATDADYAKLSETINNCTGAAERMASIKMDTMTGQLTLMQSAWEAVEVTIGEQFTPAMQELYSVGASVLGGINDFLKAHPGLVRAVAVFAGGVGAVVTAVTAVNAAIKVFQALNLAAMFTGPVGAIIGIGTAIAAVAAAVVALHTETDRLTVASKEQEMELSALNAEYQRYVDAGAETSDEALRLRYRIDELTESFDANRKTIRELAAESEALSDSHKKIVDEFESSSATAHDEYIRSLALISTYEELAVTADDSAGAQERLHAVTSRLGDSFPEVAAQLGSISGNAKDVAASYRTAAESAYKYSRFNTAIETSIKLKAEHNALDQKLTETRANLNAVMEENGYLWDKETESYRNAVNGAVYAKGIFGELAPGVTELYDSVSQLTEDLQNNAEQLDECNAIIDDYSDEVTEAAQAQSGLETALGTVSDRLKLLASDYQEALDAARKSVQGQYQIWDEAAAVVPTSVDAITKAMQGQTDYWIQYSENLDYLREQAHSVEGLGDIISGLADGSAQSINAAAGMAKALKDGSGDVTAMIAAYQLLQEAQEKVSESMALTAQNFDEKLAEMQSSLEEAVQNMDVSDIAGEAARDTIQAFIDQADSMLSQVQTAYDKLGMAAARGFALASSGSVSLQTNTLGSYKVNHGFATGTDSAPPGYAWVGEDGPELLRFSGGEQVIPADKSMELYREYTRFIDTARELTGETNTERITWELANAAGYAAGTDSAIPGYAWVGEEGPELTGGSMDGRWTQIAAVAPALYNALAALSNTSYMMNSTSKVNHALTAYSRTALTPEVEPAEALAAPRAEQGGADAAPIQITVHIHLDANATPEIIRAAEDFGGDIEARMRTVVEDVLENRRIDAGRSVY